MLSDSFPVKSDFISSLYDAAATGQQDLFDYISEALGCLSVDVASFFKFDQNGLEQSIERFEEQCDDHESTKAPLPECRREGSSIMLSMGNLSHSLCLNLKFTQVGQAKLLEESDFLSAVRKHIKRAVRVSMRLSQLKQCVSWHKRLEDQIAVPAVAVDRRGRVLKRNSLARLHQQKTAQAKAPKYNLDSSNERSRENFFDFDHIRQTPKLRHAVEQAFRGISSYQRIKHRSGQDRDSILVIEGREAMFNLRTDLQAGLDNQKASASVALHQQNSLLSHKCSDREESDELVWIYLLTVDFDTMLANNPLFTQFGLTVKESQLVASLFGGLAMNDIAQRRGVSKETLRKQLSAVFKKIGCDSQETLMLSLFKRCIYPLVLQPLVHDSIDHEHIAPYTTNRAGAR